MTRRKIRNAVKAFYETPWAMTPEKLAEIDNVLQRRAAGIFLSPEEIHAALDDGDEPNYTAMFGDNAAAESPYFLTDNGVAIVPLSGIISKRMNLLTNFSGGTSTELFGKAMLQAADDPAVRQIIIDVDSPGGSVEGMHEATDAVRSASNRKPTTAAANESMYSAAYWLGSAARDIAVTQTSGVGSIGVYTVHVDNSGMEEKVGQKRTVIKAGDFKAAGILPLTEATRENLQSQVDQIYGMFLDSVATNRKGRLTRDSAQATEARSYIGEEAIKAGLADRIGTLSELVGAAGVPQRNRISVSAFVPADK